MQEVELIDRARAGDREAFGQLFTSVERALSAFVYRLIAMRQDAEDLAQETALRALETIDQCPTAISFRAWIFRLAAQAAFEYLDSRKQWDPDAQIRAGQKLGDNAALRRRLQKLHGSSIHTTYDIREHIDFCFVCMGRTLPPQEQAALLLSEVHGFSVEEAAETLGIPPQLIRSRVQQAGQTLVAHYETRCGLINRGGSCHQCAGFDTLLHGDLRHIEQALFHIDLQPQPTAPERAATFDARVAIVRGIDPLRAEGMKVHDFLMNLTRDTVG